MDTDNDHIGLPFDSVLSRQQSMLFALSPPILDKNERTGHILGLLSVPALLVDDLPPRIVCPVTAFRAYMLNISQASPGVFFLYGQHHYTIVLVSSLHLCFTRLLR